jgi:PKD repeat protein
MTKQIAIFILAAISAISIHCKEQSVQWTSTRAENITDIKNLKSFGDNSIAYTEYDNNDNRWKVRGIDVNGFEKIVGSQGIPSAESFVYNSGDLYVVGQSGSIFKYSSSTQMWNKLSMPAANYEADDILFWNNTMYVFPKYGSIYSTNDDGLNWSKINPNLFSDAHYSAFIGNNALYVIKNGFCYISYNGQAWETLLLPNTNETIIDYAVKKDSVFIVSSSNRIYLNDKSVYREVQSYSSDIFGLLFDKNGKMLISTQTGIYKEGKDPGVWANVFSYSESIPVFQTNVLKQRKVKVAENYFFAIPSGDIVYSGDGINWKYIKKELKYSSISKIAGLSNNSYACQAFSKLFISDNGGNYWRQSNAGSNTYSLIQELAPLNNKTYYSIIDNSKLVTFDSNATDLAFKNLDFIVKSSASNGTSMFVLTSENLYKSDLTFAQWDLLKQDAKYDKIKILSDGRLFGFYKDEAIELNASGAPVDTLSLKSNFNANIKDIEFFKGNLFITSDKGLFTFKGETFSKIFNGVPSVNIKKINIVDSLLMFSDDLSNIYVSDTGLTKFSINNLSGSKITINQIANATAKSAIIATDNSGIYKVKSIDKKSLAEEYYWIDNGEYAEHSYSMFYNSIKTKNIDAFYAINNGENNTSLLNEFNFASGRINNSFDVAYDAGTLNVEKTKANNIAYNSNTNIIAVTYMTTPQSKGDSIRVIDLNEMKFLKTLNPLPVAVNGIVARMGAKAEYIKKSGRLLTAESFVLTPANSTDKVKDSRIYLWNSLSGDTLKSVKAAKFSNLNQGAVVDISSSETQDLVAIAQNDLVQKTDGSRTFSSIVSLIKLDDNTIKFSTRIASADSLTNIELSNDDNYLNVSSAEYSSNDNNIVGEKDKLFSINVANGRIYTKAYIRAADIAKNIDGSSVVISALARKDNNSNIGKIYFCDYRTLAILDSITVSANSIGKISLSTDGSKILMIGKDGLLRQFENKKDPQLLKADFSSSAKLSFINKNVEFYSNCNGNPQIYAWDFGDGAKSSDKNPIHAFSKTGNYTVSLKITKNNQNDQIEKKQYITIIEENQIDFKADKVEGFAPMTVKFTELGNVTLAAKSWDFGDGETSNETNPTHTYKNTGKYTVKYIADNGISQDTISKSNYISVINKPTKFDVDFTANVQSGSLPLTVKFTAANSITGDRWLWNFGDGSTSTEENPTHVYSDYGNYNVTLNSGKEDMSGAKLKNSFIKVSRGEITSVKLIKEYEYNAITESVYGLSSLNVNNDINYVNTQIDSTNKSFAGFGRIDFSTLEFTNSKIASAQNALTPRFMAYEGSTKFTLIGEGVANKLTTPRIVVMDNNLFKTEELLINKSEAIKPVASIADSKGFLVAGVSAKGLYLAKFNENNQYEFEKTYFLGNNYTQGDIKIISSSAGYSLFVKENSKDVAKRLNIDKKGDSLDIKNVFEDENYYINDIKLIAENSYIISGTYKYSKELSPINGFVAKYEANNLVWLKKTPSNYMMNSICAAKNKNNEQVYIAAGNINTIATIFAFDANGAEKAAFSLTNRSGAFNHINALSDNSLILTGNLINAKDKYNLYMIKLSADNSYSGLEDITSAKSSSMIVYPNPSKNEALVNIGSEISEIEIYSVTGVLVKKFNCNNELEFTMDLNDINSGAYTIVVKSAKGFERGTISVVK